MNELLNAEGEAVTVDIRTWVSVAVLAGSLGLGINSTFAQNRANDDEDFRLAEIAAHNVQEAIADHITEDANFQQTKQQPEDMVPDPAIVTDKDGTIHFDWTPAQHARHLMEELRQGIHILQSAEKPRGLDAAALAGARKTWPKMRDIFCRANPNARYYDLDGMEQYCPAR